MANIPDISNTFLNSFKILSSLGFVCKFNHSQFSVLILWKQERFITHDQLLQTSICSRLSFPGLRMTAVRREFWVVHLVQTSDTLEQKEIAALVDLYRES